MVSGSFVVPASVPAGSHTIVLVGMGADGSARTVSTPITITAAAGAGGDSSGNAAGSPAGAVGSTGGTSGSGGGALAATGAQLKALAWFGALAIAVGVSMVRTARRRRLRGWS